MNRFDRLTAILIHLQSRKIVVAQDIADRFAISLRTVYRDIRSLEEAGVPIIGEKGLGYSIMEGYRLPPVMFTEEEVIAFLMAEKVLEHHADIHNGELYKSAMFKIKAVLRSAEKTKLEQMEDSITVKQQNARHNHLLNDTLPALIRSIAEKRALHITYEAEANNGVERDIEPIGIFHENAGWNTLAWCHLEKTYRHFRTERILTLKMTGKPFHKDHPTLKDWLEQTTPKNPTFPVVISVQKDKARYLQEHKFNYGFIAEEQTKDHVRMSFEAPCLEAFSRWYITFADFASIVTPQSLKGLLKQRLETVLQEIS